MASLTMHPALTRTDYLPFAVPAVGDEEIAAVGEVLRSPWITTGPRTADFERRFAAYLGAPAALAVNSCTAALHTALAALEVGPGDEVITTPLTFAASANVIEHVGARPVLADVDPATLTVSPAAVSAAVTRRTRAILPVHYAGHPADLQQLGAIAADHGLAVVEDAAHALPASWRGHRIGAGRNLVAFSFYATKNMTTGEGGMLTGDPDILARARAFTLHGMSRDGWHRHERGASWFYEISCPGFKYNMTDLQAALGLEQLKRLEGFHDRRRQIAARYTAAFRDMDALEAAPDRTEGGHAWHLYVLRLRPDVLRIGRDQFIDELTTRNIGVSVHFIPIHVHPYYRQKYGYAPGDFPVSYDNYRRMLSLPLHPRLTDGDVTDVIDAVHDVVRVHRR